MTNPLNTLVTTQWLLPLFKEQITALQQQLKSSTGKELPSTASKQYRDIAGAMQLANLPQLSRLAMYISQLLEAIQNKQLPDTYQQKATHASRLMLHELQHYVLTGKTHGRLIQNQQHHLKQMLMANGIQPIHAGDDYQIAASIDKIEYQSDLSQVSKYVDLSNVDFSGAKKLNDKQRQILTNAWRAGTQALLSLNQNDSKTLGTLAQVATYLRDDAWQQQSSKQLSIASVQLWHLTKLWLDGLINTDHITPIGYAHLLSQLDEHIGPHRHAKLTGEHTLLIELYVQLQALSNQTNLTQATLSVIEQGIQRSHAFLPRVLSDLEAVILNLDSPSVTLTQSLTALNTELIERGWSTFAASFTQIIADFKQWAHAKDTNAHMQWQIERQLQELYSLIYATHQTIESQISWHEFAFKQTDGIEQIEPPASDSSPKARLAIEKIKQSFEAFLYRHDSQALQGADNFAALADVFNDMGMPQLVEAVQQIQHLFDSFVTQQVEHITQQAADAIADTLAALELFMDCLAQQSFSGVLLDQMIDRLACAKEHGLRVINDPQPQTQTYASHETHTAAVSSDTIRYGDEGEVTTQTDAITYLPQQTKRVVLKEPDADQATKKEAFEHNQTTVAASKQLQRVQEALKDDDFSIDPDIRDIFIEEVDDVLVMIDEQLPIWQFDVTDLAPLSDIRRGFHTLKGSGRMVGAFSISELAWAVEDLLNRILDGSIEPDTKLMQFVVDTKSRLPALVTDFKNKQPPSLDPAITVLQAQNLKAAQNINAGLPADIEHTIASQTADSQADTKQTIGEQRLDPPAALPRATQAKAKRHGSKNEALLTDVPVVIATQLTALDIVADADNADDDIKQIFIEEAQEVSEDITPLAQQWHDDLNATDVIADIRRGFHTLKGSGRMVGANTSGELAWAVENMLNRVLDNTVEATADMAALVHDVVAAYPKLVSIFANNQTDYPDTLPLWIACANAYSKKQGDEFNYNDVMALAASPKQPANKQSAEHLSIDDSPQQDADQLLIEQIFVEEVNELIADIKVCVETTKAEHGQSKVVKDELVRAFHTLRGTSASQQHTTLVDMSACLEQELERLRQDEQCLTDSHVEAIELALTLTENYLQQIKTPASADELQNVRVDDIKDLEDNGVESDRHQDLTQIQELLHSADSKTSVSVAALISDDTDDLLDAEWHLQSQLSVPNTSVLKQYAHTMATQAQALLSRAQNIASSNPKPAKKLTDILTALLAAYQHIESTPEMIKQDALLDQVLTALQAGHKHLTELLDALAGGMTFQIDASIVKDLHAVTALNAAQSSQQKEQEQQSTQAVLDAPLIIETIDTDPDLLAIFLEEAEEIDAEITTSFNAWAEQPSDKNALKILQRHLHTIKGGARMAGIDSIGELTHESETLYENFVDGKIEPSADWVRFMQSVQDVLSLQIEYVVTRGQSFFASDAVNQLKELAQSKRLPKGMQLKRPSIKSTFNTSPEVDFNTEQVSNVSSDDVRLPVADAEAEHAVQHYRSLVAQSWQQTKPDPDIMRVFLAEAAELVDSGFTYLQTFRSNTADVTSLQQLQQELHNMKEGARMLGANGLADLAHYMEAVYEDLASRQRPATRLVGELLVLCHDWITDAVLLLRHGVNPPTPTDLIVALQSFSRSPDALKSLPDVSLQAYKTAIAEYQTIKDEQLGRRDVSSIPAVGLKDKEQNEAATSNNEMIRVSSHLMEQMINLSGESAINRARIDMSVTSLTQTIDEMEITVKRLSDQLRRMDIELEAQILSQIDEQELLNHDAFDPLEMDQYSSLNQLSKSLSESASDLSDIKTTILDKTRDTESLLLQLSRTQTELQDGLMKSRMVPFSRVIPRLQRVVRQTANELGKSVELEVTNTGDDIDRTILEKIVSPLEHMLRNAVDHGIEMPSERESLGKSRIGHIALSIEREGSEIVIRLSDDGGGIDIDNVRSKAAQQGLIDANDDSLSDLDVMQYIFNAGLTTTSTVTQISGRGVGMDVVLSEVRQMGGTVSVNSVANEGSSFAIRVPLTVAVSDALVVRVADRYYAVPLVQIERIERVNPEALLAYYESDDTTFTINGVDYRLHYLNDMLAGTSFNQLTVNTNQSLPVIIVKNQAGQNMAIQVDEIAGSRIEVIVKPLGRQLSQIAGISSATIMGDGSVMLILDLLALVRSTPMRSINKASRQPATTQQERDSVLVVDDSVTVRKVTSRLLERHGFDTYVAHDGVEALEILQDLTPTVMLLDIEMPRMDGFEVASQVRRDARLKQLPIIMITSRTGDKHRKRAMEIGVNDYMGKPFQEADLIETVERFTQKVVGGSSR